MALPQDILLALTDMQQNAQSRLPVIPNNGNPHGANNMPANPAMAAPQPPAAIQPKYSYPWMAPSPSVERIRAMIRPRPEQQYQAPVQQPPMVEDPTAPILPMRRAMY